MTEVRQHPESWHRKWFEVKGSVEDKLMGLRERFLFYSEGETPEHIIILDKKINKKKIMDYRAVIEFVLDHMYKQSIESNEPVHLITLPKLTLEMLSKEKLI